MANNRVRKAVFPVAGLGTRFLPATKAQPKEMLPIVDRPLIQYAVEEAAAAGITEMIFITGRNKRSIEDHFDKAYELESELQAKGKDKLLETVKESLPSGVNCVYIRQAEPLGLGHAVLCAREVVGNEPFAILLADDLMHPAPGGDPVLKQMVDLHNRQHASVLAVQEVPREETSAYGIVSSTPWAERTSRTRPMTAPSSGFPDRRTPVAPSSLGFCNTTSYTDRAAPPIRLAMITCSPMSCDWASSGSSVSSGFPPAVAIRS